MQIRRRPRSILRPPGDYALENGGGCAPHTMRRGAVSDHARRPARRWTSGCRSVRDD